MKVGLPGISAEEKHSILHASSLAMELRDLRRRREPPPSAHPAVTSPVLYLDACVY